MRHESGEPCAQAFDFFQINPDGVPCWHTSYCEKVWQAMSAVYEFIEWAGAWHSFKEYDHIQLKG